MVILMPEARFPRVLGDMGNAGTWPFPVLYRVVRGASPQCVVLVAAARLLDDFLAAATELVAQGAEAITTNCGLLSVSQRKIAAHVQVPGRIPAPLAAENRRFGRDAGGLQVAQGKSRAKSRTWISALPRRTS
jgi:hypothetical protein